MWFTLRLREGRRFSAAVGCQRSGWDYEPGLTSHFAAEASRLYKGSTHPLLPLLVMYYCFFSPLINFCFKKKYGTKSEVWPLSISLCIVIWNGQSQSTETIHISTYMMYIKGFSLPPRWKCLFFFQSRLSVPGLVTAWGLFPFFLHLCVFLCWCCINYRTQHSTLQWRLYFRKKMFYMP